MLNEEKVRYMTQLAIFERRAGKKTSPINRCFKEDHVGGQIFHSFSGYAPCHLLSLLMWVLYKLDELLNEMNADEILDVAKKQGVTYAAGLMLYLIVTWIVYSKRYDHAARSRAMYTSKLRHPVRRYEKERPERRGDNRGERVR